MEIGRAPNGLKRVGTCRVWVDYGPLTLLLGLALILGFHQIRYRSLWLDEGYSLFDAGQPSGWNMGTRPLYYLMLHAWMAVSRDLVWLRGFSVLFFLGNVVLVFLLGRRLMDKRTGLIAGFLLAISPLFLEFARELRMYSLGTFLTLAGSLALAHVWDDEVTPNPFAPARTKPLALWALLRFLAFITAPLNTFILVADAAILGLDGRLRWKAVWTLGPWLFLALAFSAPFASKLLEVAPRFLSGWPSGIPKPTVLSWLFGTLVKSTVGEISLLAKPPGAWIAIALLGSLVFFSVRTSPFRRQAIRLALWAFLPLAVLALFSHLTSSLWLPRYFVFAAPYTILVLAAGLSKLESSRPRVFAVAILVYLFAAVAGLCAYYRFRGPQDWENIAHKIREEAQPKDIILTLEAPALRSASPLRFYLEKEIPILNQRHSTPSAVSGVWLVYRNFKSKEGEDASQRLSHRFPNQTLYRFRGMELVLARP